MIYMYNTEREVEIKEVGGKGKALIETCKKGFPVPEFIVLSVEYLQPFFHEIYARSEWIDLRANMTRDNCVALQNKIMSLKLSTEMKQELHKSLEKINAHIFAVRSSSPEEDLQNTSFAGMYESYLGVTKENIEEHILKVFASCFDYRVMSYKNKHNIDITKPSIAIIIQKQIDSIISGVAFSINPLNNCYDEVYINASFGVGESIVSGIVTPDTFVYDVAQRKITERTINKKEIALFLKRNGGTEEKEVVDQEQVTLEDEQVVNLAFLVKKCEDFYGKPVDIEWAYDSNKLYLLQTRPITTYLPFFEELLTKPGDKKKFYIDLMIMTQGFSEPMSVLGLDIWSQSLREIKGGLLEPNINGSSPSLHGRQYLNVTYLMKMMGNKGVMKLLNSYDKNIKRIFETINLKENKTSDIPYGSKGIKSKMFKLALQMVKPLIKSLFISAESVISDYQKSSEVLLKDIDNLKLEGDFKDTVQHTSNIILRCMNSVGVLLTGLLAYNSLENIFKGKEVKKELSALGMDLDGNPTSAMGYLLFDLASSDEFQKITSKEGFVKKINNRDFSEEFLGKYDEFMTKYSCRGFMEIDVASKRVYEDLGMLYDKLSHINIEGNQLLTVQEKRKEAYNNLLAIAKEMGKEKKFVSCADKYQKTFGYREHPKYLIVYIFSALHRMLLELGSEWVEKGRLKETYQIFDLNIDDISKAQSDPEYDLCKARENNLKGYKKVENVKEWPLVIDSRARIYTPAMEIKDGDILGQAIASGNVVGKVKILRSPYEKTLLPGEILVAKATEPSWTPIFTNAAGVIMEIGGPLQHGGIIAREYGIPCVSGLIGIMDILEDGDLVEVDGYNGLIRIIEKVKK